MDEFATNRDVESMNRIRLASDFIIAIMKRVYTSPQGLAGDALCYMLASLVGVSISMEKIKVVVDKLIDGSGRGEQLPIIKVETKGGIFWMGSSIDTMLFQTPNSALNIITTLYKQNHRENIEIDCSKLIQDVMKNIGNPNAKVWNGYHNPYVELSQIKEVYKGLIDKISSINMQNWEMVSALSFALIETIIKVENVFPKELNCLSMSIETLIFYSHMDT